MNSVDVAVPCYGYGHFLRACVESVLAQEEVQVRLLILDDASPDDTAAIAADLAARDPGVAFRRHSQNQGHIATYNEGLEWASAEYLLVLSADDLLTPGALLRATRLMEAHPHVGLTYGRAIVTRDPASHRGDQPRDSDRLIGSSEWIEAFCECGGNFIGDATPTVVVRTSVQKKVGGYRADLPHAGDMEMWLRFGAVGAIGAVGADQAYWRRHDTNMHLDYAGIRDFRQRELAFDVFFTEQADRIPDGQRLRNLARQRMAERAIECACRARAASDPGNYRELLEFALELCPGLPVSKIRRRLQRKRAARKMRALLRPIAQRLRRAEPVRTR